MAAYWPLALILFGLWLLLRDQVPVTFRAPLTIVGLGALILVGFQVAAAGIATVTAPGGTFVAFPVWPPMPMFGGPSVQDTVVLSARLSPGEILRLSNPSGRTTLRAGAFDEVRVQAVRHYGPTFGPPQVALRPSPGALTVETTQDVRGATGGMANVDYVIDVPTAAGADIGSVSGDLIVSGLSGPVTVRTTSGDVSLTDLDGPVTVASTSGRITGTGVAKIVEARSFSGTIDLGGTLTGDATISDDQWRCDLALRAGHLSAHRRLYAERHRAHERCSTGCQSEYPKPVGNAWLRFGAHPGAHHQRLDRAAGALAASRCARRGGRRARCLVIPDGAHVERVTQHRAAAYSGSA